MYLLLVPCILVNHINKLKKWLFYIYLLNTITKALYQSSEKGMSLPFTCPQLTEESSSLLAAAARMQLLSTAHIMQYFYQIESYHSALSCGLFSMHFDGTIILLYFIEMLLHTVSNLAKHSASASSQHGTVHVTCSIQNKELNPPHLCHYFSATQQILHGGSYKDLVTPCIKFGNWMTPGTRIILNVSDKKFFTNFKHNSVLLHGTIGSDTYAYSTYRY